MKPVKDTTLDVLEDVAVAGAKEILAYFQYQGSNVAYEKKAKVGSNAIAAFAKTRQSETGRIQSTITMKKLKLDIK